MRVLTNLSSTSPLCSLLKGKSNTKSGAKSLWYMTPPRQSETKQTQKAESFKHWTLIKMAKGPELSGQFTCLVLAASFCSSFFTSHSLSLFPSFFLSQSLESGPFCHYKPEQAFRLVSCVARKQADAFPKPLQSAHSHEYKISAGQRQADKRPIQ